MLKNGEVFCITGLRTGSIWVKIRSFHERQYAVVMDPATEKFRGKAFSLMENNRINLDEAIDASILN